MKFQGVVCRFRQTTPDLYNEKKNICGKLLKALDKLMRFCYTILANLRHHSQAVRQRSAKPLFPGPIPGGASKKRALRKAMLFVFGNQFIKQNTEEIIRE